MMTATQTVSIKDVQEASHLIHEVGRVKHAAHRFI